LYSIYFMRIIIFRFNYDIVGIVIYLLGTHKLKINVFCEVIILI